MLQRHHYIVVYLLLFCYLTLGVLGHLEGFNLLVWKTTNTQIAKAKSQSCPIVKIYWTQNKHIPSTVKISVPSPAVITPPELPRLCEYAIAFTQGAVRIPSDQLSSLHSSRAPPQF